MLKLGIVILNIEGKKKGSDLISATKDGKGKNRDRVIVSVPV